MIMSRDPGSKSKNFYFLPNSMLNSEKSYQIWGNWLKNKTLQAKKQIGGGKDPPPSAYRVKSCERIFTIDFSRSLEIKSLDILS